MTGGGPVATQDHAFVLSCNGIGELLACRTNVNVLISHIAEVKEKIETLKEQMRRLELLKVEMLATPDQQISLTDPDARSMATSGRGSGVVGYNVQIAVEANHHLIIMHEVTSDGTDRSQLSHVANETRWRWANDKVPRLRFCW
jgi:hypothetical protein